MALANKENNEAAQLPASPEEKKPPKAPYPAAPRLRMGMAGESGQGWGARALRGKTTPEVRLPASQLPVAAGIPAGSSSFPVYSLFSPLNPPPFGSFLTLILISQRWNFGAALFGASSRQSPHQAHPPWAGAEPCPGVLW